MKRRRQQQQPVNLDQVEHDKLMAKQSPEQRKAMIKGLAALARSKLIDRWCGAVAPPK